MLRALIEWTAWKMTAPKPYGMFHILFTVFGLPGCFLAARRCRHLDARQHRRLLLCAGLILLISEVYKQLFYYYVIGTGHYQWWIFPFQLCSVPMYLCILAAMIRPGRLQDGIHHFLASYNLMGGLIVFAEPSGLCHEYWTLTLHAFFWHLLLVFLGLYLVMSGRGCTRKQDFQAATKTFLGLCAIAFLINLIFWDLSGQTINMFFVGPGLNPLIIFRTIAASCGWYVATLLYIPSVCAGTWIFYRLIRPAARRWAAVPNG